MTITADIQQQEPGGKIEVFELDCTELGGDVLRFHPHLQSGPIYWQGNQYNPWPVEASGFERTGDESQPTPTITVSNVDRSISVLCMALGDLVGAKVLRRRTLVKYLDPENFPAGNTNADPTAEMPVEQWQVEQKTNEDNVSVEFTLSSPLDFAGRQLPSRQVVADLCQWDYRGTICGWTGLTYYDKNNTPTSDPNSDACSKRLSGCKCRFGDNAPLPFGGYPSAGLNTTL